MRRNNAPTATRSQHQDRSGNLNRSNASRFDATKVLEFVLGLAARGSRFQGLLKVFRTLDGVRVAREAHGFVRDGGVALVNIFGDGGERFVELAKGEETGLRPVLEDDFNIQTWELRDRCRITGDK